jgi:uncharacterized protein
MTLTNIRFPEDNPFSRIKIRQIFGWYLLLYTGIYFQIIMIGYTRGIKIDSKLTLDPLIEELLGIYLGILLLGLVWRQCSLAGIEMKYLVGKVSERYQWWPLVGLAIASVVFSISVFRVFYYPLSFVVPSFVEQILDKNRNSRILITASKTFFPALYYLIYAISNFAISPVIGGFIFIGILLHRWGAKWGNIPGIIAFCLLYTILGYTYFITTSVGFLMYAILYLKTRSIVVLIIFIVLQNFSFTIWNLFQSVFVDNQAGSVLDVFRSQIQLGVLFFALSAPWVIGFIYKNWSVLKGPLPYFANAAEAEKIKQLTVDS